LELQLALEQLKVVIPIKVASQPAHSVLSTLSQALVPTSTATINSVSIALTTEALATTLNSRKETME